ncbi:MAG: DUF2231 domain-containing protein [Thermodesulfobacteriota bacterium]
MIELIYKTFERIGYAKPLHPSMTHVSVGLLSSVFIFAVIALLFRRRILTSSAYSRLLVLSLIFALIAIATGITDWQYYYEGKWLTSFQIKVVLSGILLVFLSLGILHTARTEGESKKSLSIYAICLLCVIGLGYFGGELIWGERVGTVPEALEFFRPGEKVFSAHCNACHPGGTDLTRPAEFISLRDFLAVLRNPKQAGFPQMPAFPSDRISENDAHAIYHYLVMVYVSKAIRRSDK